MHVCLSIYYIYIYIYIYISASSCGDTSQFLGPLFAPRSHHQSVLVGLLDCKQCPQRADVYESLLVG